MAFYRTADGGKLFSDLDPRTVGQGNCTRRVNIRRDNDAEILMPGWADYGQELSGEVVFIHRATRPNGDRAILAFTHTAIYRMVDGSWTLLKDGFSDSTDWEAVDIDGYVVFNNGIDLPHVWDWVNPVEPIYEMREQGIVCCGTMLSAYDFLIFADITEIESDDLVEWMNREDLDPYGPGVPDTITTRTQYRVIWSSSPKEWGLSVGARLRQDNSEIILDFPCKSLSAGDTVNFIETEEDEDEVTAQFTEEELDSVDSNRIYLKDKVSQVNSTGVLTRSNYSSLIIGYDDLQGDGSAIMRMGMLAGSIVAFRESAILVGQLTTSAAAPFAFEEAYRGLSAPTAKKLIVPMGQRSMFFYSRDGWFEFDLSSRRPKRMGSFEVNKTLFSGLDEDHSFAIHHSPEEEVWIFLGDKTVVYDYGSDVLGELDVILSAAAIVDDPEDTSASVDRLLLLAEGGQVLRVYKNLYTRSGDYYDGILEYGWIGDSGNMRDTLLRRYIPQGTGGDVSFTLDSARSGSDSLTRRFEDVSVELGIALQFYARAQWHRESLKIQDGAVRLIGREVDAYTSENRVRGR